MCAYQESKKRADVEEGQLPEATGPTWVGVVTCVHQVCVFSLIVLWLVGGALCERGKVVSKDVEWNEN